MQTKQTLLILAAGVLIGACAPVAPVPTQAPQIITATPPSFPVVTAVPTFAPLQTATPSPIPTQPLIVRDSLSGESALYVRDRPSTLAPIVQTVAFDAEMDFTGRTEDNRWLYAIFADESEGWVLARAVETDVNIGGLPILATAQNLDYVALISPDQEDGAVLRDNPSTTAESLRVLEPLTPVQLDGRLDSFAWVQVTTIDGETGWVLPAQLEVNFDMAYLNVVEVNFVQGRVSEASGGLRMRQLPGDGGRVMINLRALTELQLNGRTADNNWLLVKIPEGYEGWVSAAFVESYVDINNVPVIDDPQPVEFVSLPTPEGAPQVVVSIGGGARNIYLQGQAAGNRRDVFTTVGDSLTDTNYFLRQIANSYNLRDYGYLLPVISFFSSSNSFAAGSLSARASWGTVSALQPGASGGGCEPGETPVACELRIKRPAVSLIMIGTNDAPAYDGAAYGERLRQIIEQTIAANVVPVLSTLPPRTQYNERIIEYNNVIRGMASQYGVPLWDLYSALVVLPGQGVGPDGVHLSVPPGGAPATVDFSQANLQYGTTMKNLTALQILDTVMNQVLY